MTGVCLECMSHAHFKPGLHNLSASLKEKCKVKTTAWENFVIAQQCNVKKRKKRKIKINILSRQCNLNKQTVVNDGCWPVMRWPTVCKRLRLFSSVHSEVKHLIIIYWLIKIPR